MNITPSPEQDAIRRYPLGPLRIAAGAGTGKTTTVALRLEYLIETGAVDPERALGITFTNKAAAELADRISHRIGSDAVEVLTYHSFAYQTLQEFGAYLGIERTARIITPGFVRQLMRQALAAGEYQHLDLTAPGPRVEEIATLAGQLADNLLEPAEVAAGDGDVGLKRSEILDTLTRYGALKHQHGVLDFGDLIRSAYNLVTRHPTVRDRIRSRYDIVLLDEYQDTNPAQRELFAAVFGDGFPVTAVGDADQTIYEWRGASRANFAGFPLHFPAPDGPAPTLPLTLNRRSAKRILEAANAIRRRIGESDAANDLAPAEESGDGVVEVNWFADAESEAIWIGDKILELHADGTPWREIAVLFRKNRHIPIIRDALTAAGVPLQVVSLGGLLGVPEVTDVYAWLRILSDPTDSAALARILLGSRYMLGLQDLLPANELAEHNRSSLLEAALDLHEFPRPAAGSAFARFRADFSHFLRLAQGVTLVELCRSILSHTRAWTEVDSMEPAAGLSARLNLYRFLDLVEGWSPLEGRPSLEAFLDYVATLLEESAPEELDLADPGTADAVSLITVHRAKGMEWDVVFVPALAELNFPARARSHDNPNTQAQRLPFEQRLDAGLLSPLSAAAPGELNKQLSRWHEAQEWRTAYVAATRPKSALYASGAGWAGSHKKAKEPSALWQLLDELEVSTTSRREEAPAQAPEPARQREEVVTPDHLFVQGVAGALRQAVADPGYPRSLATDPTAYDDQVEQLDLQLQNLVAARSESRVDEQVTSVTGLVTYATCPQRFFWSEVDPLPPRPAPWLRRGVELHRQIEMHNRGIVPLELPGADSYDFGPDESSPGEGSFAAFEASRFGQTKPEWTEVGFRLKVRETAVRGRIDAIYQDNTSWEVVDFKSGKRSDNPALTVQLMAYAMAALDAGFGLESPSDLKVTFAYLGDGLEEVTHIADEEWMKTARRRVDEIVERIEAAAFEPQPSAVCHNCDYLKFCDAGKAWVKDHP
jgi:DNA helicase-2/ATP-dependent DNA helicase PcrA